jgi:hypothetical protein
MVILPLACCEFLLADVIASGYAVASVFGCAGDLLDGCWFVEVKDGWRWFATHDRPDYRV